MTLILSLWFSIERTIIDLRILKVSTGESQGQTEDPIRAISLSPSLLKVEPPYAFTQPSRAGQSGRRSDR